MISFPFLKSSQYYLGFRDLNYKNFIYTEEYRKFTTGMASVCIEHLETQENISLLVNADHWIDKEFIKLKNSSKNFKRIGFKGLGSILFSKKILFSKNKYIVFAYKLIRRTLNLLTSPIDFLLSFISISFIQRNVKWFIHIGGWPAGSRARLLILILLILGHRNINLIIHNQPINKKFISKSFLWSLLLRKYLSNIITVSHHTKDHLKFYFPEILVINNGIRDLNSKKYISNLPYINKSSKKLKLLIISSLSPLKDTGQAFIELNKVNEMYDISWAGPIDIKYKNSLLLDSKQKVHINFLGFVKEINQLIIDNDIIIIPSKRFESFSMVFLESSMNKRPCICYESIATSELIINNQTGWVIKDRPGSLEGKLIEINRLNKNKLLELSNNCREQFIKKYTSDKMISQYESLK